MSSHEIESELSYGDKWLQRILTYAGLPAGILFLIVNQTYLAVTCFIWLMAALGYAIFKHLRKTPNPINLGLNTIQNVEPKLIENNISDGKFLPNIVCVETSLKSTLFNKASNSWIEDALGYFNLVIKFENKLLADRKIERLNQVNAQIDFINSNGKIVLSIDRGNWLYTRGSVWFAPGDRQSLIIGRQTENLYFIVISDQNRNDHTILSENYKVIVNLIGDNQWHKTFEFDLESDETGKFSITHTL